MFCKKQYLIPQSPLLKNGQVNLDSLETPATLKLEKVSSVTNKQKQELMTVHEVDEATPCFDMNDFYGTNSLVLSGKKRRGERISCEQLRQAMEKLRPKMKPNEPEFSALPRSNMIEINRLLTSGSIHD